jgi:hypothetical protein
MSAFVNLKMERAGRRRLVVPQRSRRHMRSASRTSAGACRTCWLASLGTERRQRQPGWGSACRRTRQRRDCARDVVEPVQGALPPRSVASVVARYVRRTGSCGDRDRAACHPPGVTTGLGLGIPEGLRSERAAAIHRWCVGGRGVDALFPGSQTTHSSLQCWGGTTWPETS